MDVQISADGALKFDGELVGRVTFLNPALSMFYAGEFTNDVADFFEDFEGCCPECEDKDDTIAELEQEIRVLKRKLDTIAGGKI